MPHDPHSAPSPPQLDPPTPPAAPTVPAAPTAPTVPDDLTASGDPTAPSDPTAAEEPASEDAATPEDAAPIPTATTPAPAPSGRRRIFALLALGAATVILGTFGIWATVHASSLRAQSAQQNAALTDPAGTAAVRTQIDSAVQAIFSYRYTDTGATRQAAQRMLTGPAIRQYNSLFALVQHEAPAEKLVVTTTVTSSGVELLTGDRARVLIFVNQQDTRSGTSQTSYSGAMLAVNAIREAGRWKIENIDTFS